MATDDFFRARIDQMIDLRHPLAVLSQRLPWAKLEASLAPVFAHRPKFPGGGGLDLFGPVPAGVAYVSNAGRPRLPLRLMISLLYLRLVPLLSPTPPDTLVLPEPPSSATENPIVMPYIEDVLPRLDREVERSSSQSVQIQSHSKPLHSHTL